MDFTEEHITTDFLIIGGGAAGMRAAIELARSGDVLVATKDSPSESSTEYAQGGVAVALSDEDEISIHYDDTMQAGDGLCNRGAVKTLVAEGPMRIRELILWGAEFDREGTKLAFTQEAAHTKRRILHAHGDSTGREIMRVLLDKVRSFNKVTKLDFAFTQNLIVRNGRCTGAVVLQQPEGKQLVVTARAVICATGGTGQVYERTTNPGVATGDGLAMAYRAGAALMDMEFIQFHPTALFLSGAPQFLLSEAMRGEGGMLRNIHGFRFLEQYHPARELAPRDVVTRAIHSELNATETDHVYLDMTHLTNDYVMKRFPRIYTTCKELGVDITREPIPVSPAAHYIMGGVKTDLWGATNIPGLFAAGETACTGVHGANRLASNSLLEGLVFGERAGLAAARYATKRKNRLLSGLSASPINGRQATRSRNPRRSATPLDSRDADHIQMSLKKLMSDAVGIVRDRKKLSAALKQLRAWERMTAIAEPHRSAGELQNMITTSLLIARSALLREGSVGAHFRNDFPNKGKGWRKRVVIRK
ncbi:MAG TPA: L-aspartate oxidase [Nitrospiraceae bacterium]|nr:L-aspartate oxidase [Nitrospiraceae bacterium]